MYARSSPPRTIHFLDRLGCKERKIVFGGDHESHTHVRTASFVGIGKACRVSALYRHSPDVSPSPAFIYHALLGASDNLESAPLKSTMLTVGTKKNKPEGFTWMAPDREERPTNRRQRSADLADIGEKTPEISDKDGSFTHDYLAKGEPVCLGGRALSPRVVRPSRHTSAVPFPYTCAHVSFNFPTCGK